MKTKLCYAAAFALLGWYVIIPPGPDPTLPLSRWMVVHESDSDVDCRVRALMVRVNAKQPPNNGNWVRDQNSYAQCVASNDPRLQSK
jgi:hypothetical protein